MTQHTHTMPRTAPRSGTGPTCVPAVVGHGRRSSRGWLPLVVGLIALAASGCWFSQDDHPVLMIDNRTDQTVDVFMVSPGGNESILVKALKPRQAYPYESLPTSACVAAFLLARDPQGREVDRSASPLCEPSVWLIGGDSPSP